MLKPIVRPPLVIIVKMLTHDQVIILAMIKFENETSPKHIVTFLNNGHTHIPTKLVGPTHEFNVVRHKE